MWSTMCVEFRFYVDKCFSSGTNFAIHYTQNRILQEESGSESDSSQGLGSLDDTLRAELRKIYNELKMESLDDDIEMNSDIE